MHALKAISSVVAAGFLLAACALNNLATLAGVQPGMSRQEVISRFGSPSATVALNSGMRLQYSSQPAGPSVVIVDLNAEGRVVSARQVMTPKAFSSIEPGNWTREDVQREFGRPATIDRVASWAGDIMTYRWLDSDQRMFFWVYLDSGGVVRRTGQGMEFQSRSLFRH